MRRTILFWGTVILLLGTAAIRAQGDACNDCHEVALAPSSPHVELGCTGCHAEYDESTHPEEFSGDGAPSTEVCSFCHEAAEPLAESVHAEAACQDCHGDVHGLLPVAHAESPVAPLRQIATCETCHGRELTASFMAHVHGHALLRSGLASAPSCSSCHGAHDIRRWKDPESTLSFANGPTTCGACHSYLLDSWRTESAHGIGWTKGNPEVPNCVTCHGANEGHGVDRPTEGKGRLELPETCGGCHEESLSSYRDSFHGKVTDLGYQASATCSDCHTPHANLGKEDPRSSIHPDHLAATCGACHGEVNAQFLTFDPHADPTDPDRNRGLHILWLAMTGLLLAVFSFFGVHDLLWLQRSLTAWRRGEIDNTWRRDKGPWIRRFKNQQIATHVVIVLSFLLLALTGLPLKFHAAPWAHWITSLPGSVAIFRFLHRFAAVVTFGYAFYHFGSVVLRAALRGDSGVFWGWRSMVPNLKDLQDLFHNLRYFLYREEKLRCDRWSYWEKFDYFAVFWGVPVIGLSGLMLWFPDFFTRFLPGWALNAALLVHSDEALLATGFIFLFHFFHTHLRPESFPLDPVIFVGRMPLARFKEERPLEYQRLVDRGELEEHLAAPPSEFGLQVAHVFGTIALIIGVLLAFGIFAAFLF